MWDCTERGEPWVATCLVKTDRSRVKVAQRWLSTWVGKNVVTKAAEMGDSQEPVRTAA